jgi:thioester reductase-like protein
MSIHFLTGGTGFVGTGIILELLRQTDDPLFCLVRPGVEDPTMRLHRVVRHALIAYGYDPCLLREIPQRCHAIPGDLKQDVSSLLSRQMPDRISHFWHCAASLHYEESAHKEIYATNVQGTRTALYLAQHLNVESFNHISSIGVAGTLPEHILEVPLQPRETHNYYEDSKIQAELFVRKMKMFRTRIFRIGGVIGHSQTNAAPGTTAGFYGLLQRLVSLQAWLPLTRKDTIRIVADQDCPIALIPIDIASKQIVSIAFSPSPASIFHVTNATPPTLEECCQALLRTLPLPTPCFVSSRGEFTSLDFEYEHLFAYYLSYSTEHRTFDRSNSNSALNDESAGSIPLGIEKLIAYTTWYLDALQA